MDLDKGRLRYLLESYIADNLGDEEWVELKSYVRNIANNEDLYAVIDELWSEVDMKRPVSVASDNIYKRILEDPEVLADPPRPIHSRSSTIFPWRLVGTVAALLCVAIGLFYIVRHHGVPQTEQGYVQIDTPGQPIVPGGNIATLTLADGSVIELDGIATGSLATEAGTRVIKSADGLIFYDDPDGNLANRELVYNTIHTPKGGEFRVILPDGTSVWLNAASSLRYPTSFADGKREVELVGEAYFEVAKVKSKWGMQPFIVKTKSQAVEVLGTHFNINAYDDDPVKTTLLEGSVKVSVATQGQRERPYRILKPREQAVVTAGNGHIQVGRVNVANAVAWKDGYFAFENDNITEVMKAIARWYDIEVEYDGDVSDKVFGGTISRFESFEKLLETIGLTGTIQFKITGRRVTVMT